jgi:uncharacterized protein
MHYWIDGYNLLFRIAKNYKTVKIKERALLCFLQESLIILKYTTTVVFDGKGKNPAQPLQKNLNSLKIVYTPHNQTADDYIIQALDELQRGFKETVISSDKDLLMRARQKGAKIMTVEQFLVLINKRKKQLLTPSKEVVESTFHFQRLLNIFENLLKKNG